LTATSIGQGSLRALLILVIASLCSGCALCRTSRSEQDLVAVRQLALRGSEAMQRGDAVEAERCFEDAIARYPQDERCHALLAELRKKQGRSEESTAHLERAVRLSGDDPRLLVELGAGLLEQGQDDSALDCVRRALRQDASSADAWTLYARALRRKQNNSEAIVAFHRSLQIEPHQSRVALELAEVYLGEGRLERCLSTLDSRACSSAEAVAHGDADYLRGLALARMDRHLDATSALADAERKGIRTPELYFQLAQSHHLNGSPASARLALAEAQKMAPRDERFTRLEAAIEAPNVAAQPKRGRRS
jgi:Tfp pilus assembly protein PilF